MPKKTPTTMGALLPREMWLLVSNGVYDICHHNHHLFIPSTSPLQIFSYLNIGDFMTHWVVSATFCELAERALTEITDVPVWLVPKLGACFLGLDTVRIREECLVVDQHEHLLWSQQQQHHGEATLDTTIHGAHLPPRLACLDCTKCGANVTAIEGPLPATLRHLHLAHTALATVPPPDVLPPHLELLELAETPVARDPAVVCSLRRAGAQHVYQLAAWHVETPMPRDEDAFAAVLDFFPQEWRAPARTDRDLVVATPRHLRTHPDVVAAALHELARVVYSSSTTRDQFLAANGVPMCLRILIDYGDHAGACAGACCALAVPLIVGRGRDQLLELNGMAVIVRTLATHMASPATVMHACCAIADALGDAGELGPCHQFVACDGLQQLVRVLQTHVARPDVLLEACRAVVNVLGPQSENTQESWGQIGGVQALVALLVHQQPVSPKLGRGIAWALSNALNASPANQRRLNRASGVKHLLELMVRVL